MSQTQVITNSFTNKIAGVFILLIIFVIFALTLFSYLLASSNITDRFIKQEIPNQTEIVLNKIENYVEPLISISANMANSYYTLHWILEENESEEGRIHYRKEQQNLIKKNGLETTFLVSLLTNTYYVDGNRESKIDLNGKDSWMNYILNSPDDYQVNVDYRRGSSKDLYMFINYKMKDEKGNLIGITGTVVKINEIMEMFFDRRLGNTGYYLAADKNGLIQMHPNKEYIQFKHLTDIEPNADKIINSKTTNLDIIRYRSTQDNQEYFIATKYLKSLNWTIFGKISVNESFAQLNKILIFSLIVSFIILVVALFFAFVVSSRFKKRIGEVTSNMSKFMKYISNEDRSKLEEGNNGLSLTRSDENDELAHMTNEIYESAEYVIKLLKIQEALQNELQVNSLQVIEKNRALQKLSDQTIYALSSAIDAKDSYTNGHSLRVAKYSKEIARRMGKSEEEQNAIFNVALLHDVGKIAIPDFIINKTSKLTDIEFQLIKSHTMRGYEILKGITVMPNLYIGARWHHERYDGRGYPDGKKGDEIPEVARIICVADCYDAMTSDRSYRKALPQEVARSEILKNKGSQFDPEIADVMLIMIDEDPNYTMRGDSSHYFAKPGHEQMVLNT